MRVFRDIEHNIMVTEEQLLEDWDMCGALQSEYATFSDYVRASQVHEGGILEEVKSKCQQRSVV